MRCALRLRRFDRPLAAGPLLPARRGLFAGLSGEQDELAGLELRTRLEAGVEVVVLAGPPHRLSFDLGLDYTDEDRVEPAPDVSSPGAVAGLDYEWTLSESASLAQRLLYFASFDDGSDWRAESTTALSAALSKRLALQVSYEVRYRNRPIDANDDTDTAAKASVVVKL